LVALKKIVKQSTSPPFMKDLEVIKKLEIRFEKKFKRVELKEIQTFASNFSFAVDIYENVCGLKISSKSLNIIPVEIFELKNLTHLNLQSNSLKDISGLEHFKKLIDLTLYDNEIVDISVLSELKNLNYLNIGSNNLTKISSLAKLKKLVVLQLYSNVIKDISPLSHLTNIEHLNLHSNQLTDISPLYELTTLIFLRLSHNNITNLSPIANLKSLKELYLTKNEISDITPLSELKLLRRLTLMHNPIKKIPFELTNLGLKITWEDNYSPDDGTILFYDNPLVSPPVEIVKQGEKAIVDWFNANKKRLNEIKILLIGEAKAGKTSICYRLKYDTYNANQKQTDGIVIEKFPFEELRTFDKQKELHGTLAYFWDFGGQEIMSSTHQFFMTKRSIYVLVLEARKDADTDKQIRRWLERIQTFGGNSPVIVVGNKIDLNPAFGVDTTSLQKDFPQISSFINVSAETGENIDKLKTILAQSIPLAQLFGTEIDERWIDIKSDLQKLTDEQSKLSHEQFVKICNQHNLTDPEIQGQAINFLNDLGIVLHFDELTLSEYYVLNPLWVTGGVYRIITSERAARQKGEILTYDLPWIINEEFKQSGENKHRQNQSTTYSPNECRFLADIMAQFKLGYYFDNYKKILIPDLLDKETPQEESERFDSAPEKLSLIYHYKYMPTVLMPRLIVELKNDVAIAWRSGVKLINKGSMAAEAMVTAIENEIRIVVLGEYKQKRAYLSVIRYFIDQINSNYNVEVNMLIPLPGYDRFSVKYDTLVKMERSGEKTYKNWDIEKEFEISKLLDGIETKEEVQSRLKNMLDNEGPKKKFKIFLASSSELKTDREQFEIYINRKNKVFHDRGLFLELIIWEDFPDSMSQTRLQDEYNKAIKDCNIFIMLFFTKVGKYTTEEFEIAFGHFRKNNRPVIFTYFKNAEITTGNLNKSDTLSLLDFKDRLDKLGHFYTEYKNIEDLKFKFSEQLEKLDL